MNACTKRITSALDLPRGEKSEPFMFGMYKKLTREFTGTFTGKGREFGGSLIRPEANFFSGILSYVTGT